MASPFTQGSSRALSITPGSRALKSPLGDETIWKRLKEAGFDEESIKKRDKAALIAYIANLEAELSDHQHHMGLLTLEGKELASKYEQIKASAEASELRHKRDHAAHISALAEAKKREDGLKKALGVEKECLASIEKALHEMRAESAETKVAAESRLAEARIMIEDAEKKIAEAEAKFHVAKSLQAEATLIQRDAKRKLQEVEAREDGLCRRIVLFKNDSDAKDREITRERQLLSERQKIVQQEHERLLDGKASLNQREEYIFSRTQELNQLEKELQASKADIEKERRALKDEKSNFELTLVSLSKREEAIIEQEALLSKKEKDLLVSQEKLASKDFDEFRKAIASHENALRTRNSEFEAELQLRRKLVEDEIEMKRRAMELKEMDINHKEDQIFEREHDLDVRLRILAEKEKEVDEKSNLVDVRTKALRSETHELSSLELKLKEELDMVRAQKLELMADVDRLEVEKAKFETEWESIDEKREELQKEAARVCEEREAISKFLKDERDKLRNERDMMREQHYKDVESLNREREDFMKKMASEHSDWFQKIQQERADFLLGIEMQKRELENCIEKRHEELESSFKEREEAFEREKKNQLDHINALKENVEKELELATLEIRRLDAERLEIKLDRERREHEWADLNKSVEELKVQRHKLKQQRELLHEDRKEIHVEIEELKKLGDLKAALDNMKVAQMQRSILELSQHKASERRNLKQQAVVQNGEPGSDKNKAVALNGNGLSSLISKPDNTPSSAHLSWIKRCSELIFKHTPAKAQIKPEERSSISDHEDSCLTSSGRKRRVDSISSKDTKNSRQKKEASVIAEDITLCVNSIEPNTVLDQQALMSYNQNQGVDETNALIGDIVADISEVIHVKETVDDFSNQGNILGNATGDDGKPGEPLVMQKVHMGNASHVTKLLSQPMEGKSEKDEQNVEDDVAAEPDEDEKTELRAGLKQLL
ncbi:Adenylate kinase 1 isoform 2 [Hibiscus syriacus]|uniref:Adenylate kinase 1 isoform 2 n=1 Tax=Hibiscus syriacus TaxID=106335 RepID=A0A6A2ZR68_HIBSY|nr:protein CROWDED NUCLEI 4-like [Hibiscus syriacus]KAE8693375.1 Adenylate kinase 1 isoform 2 [Hibiscus syriacus]